MSLTRGHGIVLVGLATSGKSTVGRILAERLGRRSIDTDELLERQVGAPAPAYLTERGEDAFRAAERRAVIEACAQPGGVIAAGGGAVIDPLDRWDLWSYGTVVWLRASDATLVRRLRASETRRPLYEPYGEERVAELAAERAPFYRAADLAVDAEPAATAVADEILARLPLNADDHRAARLFAAEVPRHHPIGTPSTRIVYGVGSDAATFSDALGLVGGGRVAAIVDERLARLTPALLEALPPGPRRLMRAGERVKRLRVLEDLLAWLAAERVERGMPLLAVGGGTIGDLAGTAAALYARGLPLAHVPTSWLAQADSAIGGKVAVDLSGAKNAVGAFWPPAAVLADVSALRSLPRARRRDGMAESLKAALIGDPRLYSLIEERGLASLRHDEPARYAIVERAVRQKLAVCERDPFETGERRTLNLGHTIGHALEVAGGYRLPHGGAVALGLRAVAAIAERRGADPTLRPGLDALLARLGFAPRHAFDPAAVRGALGTDKKRAAGRQRWILPMAVGQVLEVDDVSDAELEHALAAIQAEH